MVRFFAGLIFIIFGLVVAGKSFYYAWASSAPDIAKAIYDRYQIYSLTFGLISVGIIFLGVLLIVLSVKKSNREYSESQKNDNDRIS